MNSLGKPTPTYGSFDNGQVLQFSTSLSASGKVIFFGGNGTGQMLMSFLSKNPKKYFGIKNKKSREKHLLRKLLASERFVVRSKNFRQEEFTAIFELDGFADNAVKVIEDCRVM